MREYSEFRRISEIFHGRSRHFRNSRFGPVFMVNSLLGTQSILLHEIIDNGILSVSSYQTGDGGH